MTGWLKTMPKTGELVFFKPIFSIDDLKFPAIIVNETKCKIQPYSILHNGGVKNAMREEILEVEDGI